MKILITGACGFVGSTLTRTWREHSPDVSLIGIDNLILGPAVRSIAPR